MNEDLILYIDNNELDVTQEELLRFTLSFTIADITDLSNIKNSTSKTITLPGTDNNRKLLGFAEFPTAAKAVDQTTKPVARVEKGGTDIIHGFLKMVHPLHNSDDELSSYQVVIIGDSGDWKIDMRKLGLDDLDFSDEDHEYSAANTATSETVSAARSYVYPLINYGHPSSTIGEVATQDHDIAIEDRYPAMNAAKMLIKMFQNLGYTITGNFIDSAFFKGQYIPFTKKDGLRGTKADTVGNLFRAGLSGDIQQNDELGVASYRIIVPFDDDTGGDLFDTAGVFNTTTFEYVWDIIKEANFFLDINVDWLFASEAAAAESVVLKILKEDSGGNVTTIAEQDFFRPTPRVKELLSIETGIRRFEVGDKVFAHFTARSTKVRSGYKIIAGGGATGFAATRFYNDITTRTVEGNTVNMNTVLPEIPQLDFIGGLQALYNLYFKTDITRKTVLIEPRDDFYLRPGIDWSDKVNLDKVIKIGYLGENLKKNIRYRYTDDSNDIMVEGLNNQTGTILASRDVEIANEFAPKGIKEITTIFSPTIMNTWKAIGLKTENVPQLWSEESTSEGVPPWDTEYNIRILFYYGVVTLPDGDGWTYDGSARTDFPKMSSVDRINLNDNSLYFNDTEKSFGLFKKFYETTHKVLDEGRLVTMFIHLTEQDINLLDFRNTVNIELKGDGREYVLNRIKSYSPNKKGGSEVELLTYIVPPTRTSVIAPDDDGFINDDRPREDWWLRELPTTMVMDVDRNVRIVIPDGGGEPEPTPASFRMAMNLSRGMTSGKNFQLLMGQHGFQSATHKMIIGTGEGGSRRVSSLVVDENGTILANEGLAGFTLLPAKGIIDSTIAPPTEVDGDVYILDASGTSYPVGDIVFQSGNIIRYTSPGADFSTLSSSDWLEVISATNEINNGRFMIRTVDDGSDFLEVTNIERLDGTDDEIGSPATMTVTDTDYDSAGQHDWIRYYSADDQWRNIPALQGMQVFLEDIREEWLFAGGLWLDPSLRYAYPPRMFEGFRVTFLGTFRVTIGPGTCRDFANTFNINEPTGFTCDLSTVGADGRDAGTLLPRAWYALYVIVDTTGVLANASLASLSQDTPGTLPAGYDAFRQVGWTQVNFTATDLVRFFEVPHTYNARWRRYYSDDERPNQQMLVNGNFTGAGFLALAVVLFIPGSSDMIGHFQATFEVTSGATAELQLKPTNATQVLPQTFFTEPSVIGQPTSHYFDMPMRDLGLDYRVTNALDFANLYVQGFSYEL